MSQYHVYVFAASRSKIRSQVVSLPLSIDLASLGIRRSFSHSSSIVRGKGMSFYAIRYLSDLSSLSSSALCLWLFYCISHESSVCCRSIRFLFLLALKSFRQSPTTHRPTWRNRKPTPTFDKFKMRKSSFKLSDTTPPIVSILQFIFHSDSSGFSSSVCCFFRGDTLLAWQRASAAAATDEETFLSVCAEFEINMQTSWVVYS